MSIFELLSFDFQEFATSPAGILIIVGILFLLVGIVIFLKEGKKQKKQVETSSEATPAATTSTTTVEATTEPVAEASVAPAVEPVATEPVATPAPALESAQEATPIVVPTEGDGVKEVAVEPVSETINFNESTPVANESAPVEAVKPETLDATVPSAAPVVESLDEPAPTVYGGASPEVSKEEILDEKPREIYGGANPLDNTAPIPAVVEAASVTTEPAPAVEEAKPVEAVTTPSETTPVTEPVTEPAVAQPEEKKEEIEKLEF